jgi:hypothetical protein
MAIASISTTTRRTGPMGPPDVKPRMLAWLLPVVFALHNGEEALTIDRYLPVLKSEIPAWAAAWVPELTASLYLVALPVVTGLGVLAGLWVLLRPESRAALWTLLLFQAVLLLNAMSHLATAALLHGYAPGVVTAALINLPLSVLVFRNATRDAWLAKPALLALIPAALIVHGPLLVALFALLAPLAAR